MLTSVRNFIGMGYVPLAAGGKSARCPAGGLRGCSASVTTSTCIYISIHVSDAVAAALITTIGVITAALITGLATVIAAWLQSRGGPK